jgi:hypothetical protein
MSLPRFFYRAADAAAAAGPRLTRDVLEARLEAVVVTASTNVGREDPRAHGYLLAVNLLARLYPRLQLVAPPPLRSDAEALALSINPSIELLAPTDDPLRTAPELFRVHVGGDRPATSSEVTVDAAGWVVAVDVAAPDGLGPAAPSAALAAAALATRELFRAIFAEWMNVSPRVGPVPAFWDVVTGECRDPQAGIPAGGWTEAETIKPDLGTVHLAGAGAVGQAATLTWRAAGASGVLVPVDHQIVDVGNLQRYVLTTDASEGETKVAIIASALEGSSLVVQPELCRWGESSQAEPGRHTVAVALDSADDRLGVAGGTHGRVYNAWTSPVDVGWSRHESFGGDEVCLGCLYWPRGPQPSLNEKIATALQQDPLRIRMYLSLRIPIATVPPTIQPRPGEPLPAAAARWTQRSLLEDLVASGRIAEADAARWATSTVKELWHDAVCASMLARLPDDLVVDVPLAHASALAGIMLATQVIIANDPRLLRRRDGHVEARIDVARPLPQILGRPRQPHSECICRDPAFVSAWIRTRPA